MTLIYKKKKFGFYPEIRFRTKKEELLYYIKKMHALESSCKSLYHSGVSTIDIKIQIKILKSKILSLTT